MLKSTTLLLASSISVSVLAQPVLLTELESGDNWLETNYEKVSEDIKRYSEGNNDSFSKIHTESFGLTGLTVFSTKGVFRPFIKAGVIHKERMNSDTEVFSLSTGALFEYYDSKKAHASLGFNKSDNKVEIRNSIDTSISFQTTNIDSSIKNQLTFATSYLGKFNSVEGGHTFNITNKAKCPLASKVDLVATIGMILTSDLGSPLNTYDSDPEYSLGIDINIHPIKDMTIVFSLQQSNGGGTIEFDTTEVNIDQDNTVSTVALISRF